MRRMFNKTHHFKRNVCVVVRSVLTSLLRFLFQIPFLRYATPNFEHKLLVLVTDLQNDLSDNGFSDQNVTIQQVATFYGFLSEQQNFKTFRFPINSWSDFLFEKNLI